MKYIVYTQGLHQSAIIFDDRFVHYEVARRQLEREHCEVESAGFCHIKDGQWVCHGKSESLNVASKPTDAFVLNMVSGALR